MRENLIKGIMTSILETQDKKSAFEIFLEGETINMKSLSGGGDVEHLRNKVYVEYLDAKKEYKRIICNPENNDLFNRMKELEILIMQSRSLIGTVTKLSMINQKRGGSETSYIIARAPFFNPDNVKAEIRVYLGKTEEIGRSIEELSRDVKFMDEAERQIVNAMKEVMEKRKVEASVKKKLDIKQLINANEVSEIESDVNPSKLREDPRLDPFNPGSGPNPKPKHYGIPLNKKK